MLIFAWASLVGIAYSIIHLLSVSGRFDDLHHRPIDYDFYDESCCILPESHHPNPSPETLSAGVDITPLMIPTLDVDQDTRTRLLVLQHFNLNDDRVHTLQNISLDQHTKYAEYWGYTYETTTAQYVSPEKEVRQRQMNKLYALQAIALRELAKGKQGARWIMMTDADVLFRNPFIPVHSLLPPDRPDDTRPPPLIVGTEDFNGFNSGNIIYRVGPDLISFISHAFAIADDVTRRYEAEKSRQEGNGKGDGNINMDGWETPPSDQRALCLTLEAKVEYSTRFYHYDTGWLNAYPGWELPDDRVMLNTHMVADHKYRSEFDEYRGYWDEIYGKMLSATPEEVVKETIRVRKVAEEWWKTARVECPKCTWI